MTFDVMMMGYLTQLQFTFTMKPMAERKLLIAKYNNFLFFYEFSRIALFDENLESDLIS